MLGSTSLEHPQARATLDQFKRALAELGYVEGRNIVVELRAAKGPEDPLSAIVAEFLRLKVDVIVASSHGAVAARQATSTVPIVMPVITDPVKLGLVASLARPGGNATGLATQNDELPGKWLAMVREILPKAARVAALFHPTYDGGVQLKAAEAAARALGMQLQALTVETSGDLDVAFAQIQKQRAEALVVSSSGLFYWQRARLVDFAARRRLPTVYHQSEFVVAEGGLMSYGPDFRDLFRRSATYVDKILKGAKPGDLPVEQPTKFELVVNQKTARALGLALPAALLLRADRVID
jgi:putative ABC transport system substrate-binding protein